MENTQGSTDPGKMNPDFFSAKWQQMRGTLRSWWGKLSDEDWERIGGQKDRLIGMLQEKYGYAKDMALREVERRLQEYSGQSGPSEGIGSTTYNAGQEAENAKQNIAQGAANAYSDAKAKAQELGTAAAGKVGGATKVVGEKMSSLAGTIREKAPQEGTIGSAAQTVANQLDNAGSYLQDKALGNMTQDVSELIRRYPIPSLLIGIGIGYLLSRRSVR
jgi:uncharacterized protein YjbJ (UPF0337 family)